MERLNKLNGKSYLKALVPRQEASLDNVTDSVKYKTILQAKNNPKKKAKSKEFGFLAKEFGNIFQKD